MANKNMDMNVMFSHKPVVNKNTYKKSISRNEQKITNTANHPPSHNLVFFKSKQVSSPSFPLLTTNNTQSSVAALNNTVTEKTFSNQPFITFQKNQVSNFNSLFPNTIYENKDGPKISIEKCIELVSNVNKEIPRKIFQTWPTIDAPKNIIYAVDSLKTINSEFEYALFDDIACRNFIYTNFDEAVLRAYDALNSGRFKSDLWKFCVLYIHGGVYIDLKYEPIGDFKLSELINNEHFVLDNLNIYTGFMISRPGNPMLYAAILRICENVKSNFYGMDKDHPTGSRLLSDVFKNANSNMETVDMKLDKTNDHKFIVKDKKRLMRSVDDYNKTRETILHNGGDECYRNRNLYNTNDIHIRNNVIPMTVYQTWHTKDMPEGMRKCREMLMRQNPEFSFQLFDDKDCRNFIRDHFDNDVLLAFDKIIPGAYKADLWRYCVLFINGGIYLDCKYFCINNFKLSQLLSREYLVMDLVPPALFNAFMVCKPKNPILLECIQRIVKNARENNYGADCLDVTGPRLLGDVYFKYNNRDTILLYHKGNFPGKEFIQGVIHHARINKYILAVYPNYRSEQRNTEKARHYGELWRERKIYDMTVRI